MKSNVSKRKDEYFYSLINWNVCDCQFSNSLKLYMLFILNISTDVIRIPPILQLCTTAGKRPTDKWGVGSPVLFGYVYPIIYELCGCNLTPSPCPTSRKLSQGLLWLCETYIEISNNRYADSEPSGLLNSDLCNGLYETWGKNCFASPHFPRWSISHE